MADPVLLCLLLSTVTVALYWPATGFQFVNLDDKGYFAKNAHVQSGLSWEGCLWAFGSGDLSNWHPLTWLSLMFDVTLFGNGGPAGPHFTNILFHTANTVLLFLSLRYLTGANWRSVFVAGLFALHPLNVESVAWVSERKNVLSTFFWLLTTLTYTRYARSATVMVPAEKNSEVRVSKVFFCDAYYMLTWVFFAMGLMSKPMLVTLPFVFLLLDSWPLRRWQLDSLQDWRTQLPRLALEKSPLLLLSALSCVVTFMVQQQGKAVQSLDHYSISARIGNAFISYWRYLGKTFWPENLTVFCPHPGQWPLVAVVSATVFVLVACLTALWLGRRFPFLITGWFWFLGTLIPVIGLVQVGSQSMADRYAYVPLIGIFIIISWGAVGVLGYWKLPKAIMAIAAGLVLTSCALRTRDQLGYWHDDGALFQRAIALTPNYSKLYLIVGDYFERQGSLNEAIKNYRSAIRIEPNYLAAHVNLGFVLDRTGQIEEAVSEFREAMRIDPHSPEIRYNLGCELFRLGQREEAIEQFRQALRLQPDFELASRGLQQLGVSQSP